MTTNKIARPSAIAFVTMALVACSAQAQEAVSAASKDLTKLSLEELLQVTVVTPSREQRIMDLPASAIVLTGDEIRADNFRSLPQSLEEIPGIWVQKTAFGQGSPVIRGFTGFRNLLLIDGVRLNNAIFREGPNQYWSTVEPWTVAKLEIARGPFSTQWGSDAVGGVVQVRTNTQNASPGTLAVGGATQARYASAEQSISGRAEAHASGAHAGFLLGFVDRQFGDLSGGRNVGRQPDTGYDEINGDAKVEWLLGDDARLVWAFQRVSQNDVPRTHKTIHAIVWKGTTVGTDLKRDTDQDRTLTYLQLHQTKLDSIVDEVHASISYHRQAEEQDLIRSKGDRRVSGVTDDQFGAFVHLNTSNAFGLFTNGFDYYHDEVDSFENRWDAAGTFTGSQIQGPVGDNADSDLLGAFSQYETAPVEHLTLLLGARFTYAAAGADKVASQGPGPEVISAKGDWTSIDGSVRGIYHLSGDWSIWAGASTAFRAPNLSDLTRLDSAKTSEYETPSTHLTPERFYVFENGAKWNTGRIGASLAGYYTIVDDMIRRFRTGVQDDSGSFEIQKANIGDGFVTGFELDFRARVVPQGTVFGGVGYAYSRVDNLGASGTRSIVETLDKAPPLMGILGGRWDFDSKNTWIELVGKGAADADRLSESDKEDTSRIPPGGTPGFFVVGVRGGTQLSKHFTVSVAVENVFNEDYRYHGSGSNEAGTNFAVTLRADI